MAHPSNLADHYDVIVIGTGAGGGTAGYKLASLGKHVLFVERGKLFDDAAAFQDEQAMQIDKRASDNRCIDFGEITSRAFIGGVVGGSTALYGGCLMRPGLSDFTPGRYYGHQLDRKLWEWPVAYEEMAPYYDEAEELYRVAGINRQSTPHLKERDKPYPATPLPLHPTNIALQEGFTHAGLHPFILPMGIDPEACEQCAACPGYICPCDARASSLNRCISPAVKHHNADLVVQTEVESVHTRGRLVTGLVLKNSSGHYRVTTSQLIVACGAIGSPVFLKQHRLTGGNDIIGRNYMFHLGVICSALCARPTGAGRTFIKQLGLTDFYFSKEDGNHKLGYIQQLPIPGILTMRSQLPFPVPHRLLESAYLRNITFAGAIEDLPQATNRVSLKSKGITIHHRYHAYDIFRAKLLKKEFMPFMRQIPSSISMGLIAKKEKLHVAHQVGTCRFGDDPAMSALDRNCRLHHMDNIHVLDGSFMPTSLGVAPALTIMANALRVVTSCL